MKARIMGRTVEIHEGMVRGGVDSRPEWRKLPRATDLSHARPGKAEGTLTTSPLPGWPDPTKNRREKWNYAYAQYLELQKRAGEIKHWWYEPSTFVLPGNVKFTPDFLIQYPDGLERKLHYVEIKGWSKNIRDGITRYKIAAAMFPCFTWSMMKRAGNGWEEYGL